MWGTRDILASNGIEERFIPTDVGNAHDAVAMGKNKSYSMSKAESTVHTVVKYSGFPFHTAESVNKQVTFIAAFQLEYQKSHDYDTAFDIAIDVMDKTQFDPTQANRPRHLMGGTARVLTLFVG